MYFLPDLYIDHVYYTWVISFYGKNNSNFILNALSLKIIYLYNHSLT